MKIEYNDYLSEVQYDLGNGCNVFMNFELCLDALSNVWINKNMFDNGYCKSIVPIYYFPAQK